MTDSYCDGRTANDSVSPAVAKEDGLAGTFWNEDDWTCEDEREAQRILQQAQDQCRISATACQIGKHNSNSNIEDSKAWDAFYRNHKTNFFKDRHYLHKAFPDEFGIAHNSTNTIADHHATVIEHRTLVEVGCGVGNTLLPLLQDDNLDVNTDNSNNHSGTRIQWTVHGLDLSKVAIEWLQKDERFIRAANSHRATAHVCDISLDSLPPALQYVADVTTLLFCLSAIAPGPRMVQAARNVAATLRPAAGVLVFRDYGRYDQAQMKLGTSRNKQCHDYDDNFYRKHDGTKCYYFTVEDVQNLFERDCGLQVMELGYVRRVYRNRAQDQVRRRVWVQGRFRRKTVEGEPAP